MTAKRFMIIKGLKKGTHSGIWDNQKQHNMGIGDELWLGEVVAMLNEGVTLAEENEQLKQFKERVFLLIDKRIRTLEANSKQCHQGGSHEKGIEFTLQAELLERLKKELE